MDSALTKTDVAGWDQVFRDFDLITFLSDDSDDWGLIHRGALATTDGRIAWVGTVDQLPADLGGVPVIPGHGQLMTPGLIDCHTHLVYGGNRAEEWQMRLKGKSYEEIARAGGGIRSTMRATRETSEEGLLELARGRAANLVRQGVTTVEIKSGYALDVAGEIKMLRVVQQLGQQLPVDVHPTFLGAHCVPPEFEGRPDDYVEVVVNQMIPQVQSLATAVDVFTENIAFDLAQTERVFQAALEAGLAIKIHAEQLSNMGGAKLAAGLGALSADHLEYLDSDGVAAMADHGTVAVLLPGAFYFLNETQQPPVQLFRDRGVPMALATDTNPGSSPVASILLMANMGCTLFGMTPAEAMRGLTTHAARALGIQDSVGRLVPGMKADLATWQVQTPAELAFTIGHNPCAAVYRNGKRILDEDLSF